jgi:hypothetical protein
LSQIAVAIEFMLNGHAEWEGALPFAAVLNAVGLEEIFNTDQSLTEELIEGRNKMFCRLVWAKNGGHVLLLERNEDPLFPNGELEEILTKETYNEFKLVFCFVLDEIMVYRRDNPAFYFTYI